MEGMGFVGGAARFNAGVAAGRPCAARCGRVVPSMAEKSVANRERRSGITQQVRDQLDKSEMAFALPLKGYTVKQVEELRRQVPESTLVMAVKNTLMRRAVADSKWEAAEKLTTGSNLWVFVGDDMKKTVESVNKFNKEMKKEETNGIIGGIMDGEVYDAAGVVKLMDLPSKEELYARIAGAIQMVPTKLGRGVKAVPTKVAKGINEVPSKLVRAIKLATEEK